MAGFWQDAGDAYGNYMAGKSPLAAAAYQGVTGHAPAPAQGQNPAEALANSIIARYKRAPDSQDVMTGPKPTQNELNQPIAAPPAPADPTYGASQPAPEVQANSQWTKPDGQYGQGGGLLGGSIMNQKKSGGGGAEFGDAAQDVGDLGGDAALEGLALLAHGGMAAEPMIAKVGEAGPEMAGGRIISSPSIVALKKGESVVPLTPHASNKLQPDLIEGHVAAPNPQGIHYSRYKAYGNGKGLMR